MKLSPYTYNSTAINDATNYNAWLPNEQPLQGEASPVFVERPDMRPVYTGKRLKDGELVLCIKCNGTFATQLDTLKALFNTEDQTARKFICKDTANSDKQWYVYCTPVKMEEYSKATVTVTLAVADPVWYEETESSDTWAITASGQKKEITPAGNLPAAPRFVITPTSAGGTGYAYKKFIQIYSPVAAAFANYPLQIAGTWDTSTAAAGAVLKNSTNYVLINNGAGIAIDAVTIAFDGEVGTLPTSGLAMVDNEQISYTGKSATELTGCTRGVHGSTAATHADDAIIYQSKVQKDGGDLRVMIDGAEVNFWLDGMYTATTKVWIAADFKVKRELTLGTAIANPHTTLTTITWANTSANLTAAKAMPSSGILLIESELYTYTGINTSLRQFTGVTPTVKGSSSAAHSAGVTIRWIEHDIWLLYGNQTADAQVLDDTHKPIINLNTSTNTSWVYESFYDLTGLRAGSWKPSKLGTGLDPTNGLGYYTGNNTALADPATEMGMSLYTWQVGNLWRTAYGLITWQLYSPAGFTTATVTGEKYRYTTNWPIEVFQKSLNGVTWTTVWTEVTPASAQTWTALAAHSAVALSATYYYVRFSLAGTLGATASNQAHYEIEAVTLVPDSAKIPQITVGDEQNNYHLQAKITNNLTGEYITLNWPMVLNSDLTVDCLNRTVTHSDNTNASAAITFSSVRRNWLNLTAGTANELQFDDTGTAGVTFKTYWRDRNS